jgi:hypothetical protein
MWRNGVNKSENIRTEILGRDRAGCGTVSGSMAVLKDFMVESQVGNKQDKCQFIRQVGQVTSMRWRVSSH